MTALHELINNSSTLNNQGTNSIIKGATTSNTTGSNLTSIANHKDTNQEIKTTFIGQEFSLLKPDLATPPQSPHLNFVPTVLPLNSLTSSTSSIDSIDEAYTLEETIPQGSNCLQQEIMNLETIEKGNKESTDLYKTPLTSLPSLQSSNELVLSILDDLIENQVVAPSNINSQQKQEENIARLKTKIQKNNEVLRENLKSSYRRLRLIQTKCFQTHVAQQLNNILELKERQKLENVSETIETSDNKQDETREEKPSVIDDTSVDLLTSIIKSNLSDTKISGTTRQSESVDAAVKSLLDDIQYEILKQSDEKLNGRKQNSSDSDTDDQSEAEDDSSSIIQANDDSNTWKFCKNNNSKQSVNVNVNTLETSPMLDSCSLVETVNKSQVQNETKKLVDSSNLFWTKTRAQLGSEWTRVQIKMKQLKVKSKQCNDYLNKQDLLIENFESKLATDNKSTIKEENPENLAVSEAKTDEVAAIAALSTSLQESVAAEVFATTNSPMEVEQDLNVVSEPTASRCLPYDRTKTSRLFNLNRNDLIELDDDKLKSFYFTLRYFSNNYFKTMCLCQSNDKSSARKNNYYYKKKQLMLQKEQNAENTVQTGNKKSQSLLAADILAESKTCIFCHLLKKYEQNRMDVASFLNNKTRSMDAQNNSGCRKKKQLDLLKGKYKKKQRQGSNEVEINLDEKNDSKKPDATYEHEIYQTFADPNLVNRDHSYCKQPNPLKKNFTLNNYTETVENCEQKEKLKIETETEIMNEEFLDKLVGNRLNRIYDGFAIKTEKNDYNTYLDTSKTSTVNKNCEDCRRQQEDELIDAGLDLTPDDLQKLPDLSYEELKYLNEIELDKNAYRKKFEFVEDSIDMSYENNGFSRDFTSFLSNKPYSIPYQTNSEIFHALSYKPKYRSLLIKKSRKQKKSDLLESDDLKIKNIKQRGRKIKQNKLLDIVRRDSVESEQNKNPIQRGLNVRPRKRQRSTSSYSSNSSILSSCYNDNNDNMSTSPSVNNNRSTSFYNYFSGTNSQNYKYDIDNIVIPFDSANHSSSIKPLCLSKKVNVPTPKWREHILEPMVNIIDEVPENLNDAFYEEMHKLKEKKRFESNDKRLKLRSEDLSMSLPVTVLSNSLNENKNSGKNKKKSSSSSPKSINCLDNGTNNKLNSSLNLSSFEWLPRKFPLTELELEIMKKQDTQLAVNIEQTVKK